MFVGFDSKLIDYPVPEQLPEPPNGIPYEHFEPIPQERNFRRVFKFLLGASIATLDEDTFRDRYIQSLANAINSVGFSPTRNIYSSHLLVTEVGYKVINVIPRLLNSICNEIERIDIYCAYYTHPMSVYGESQGERMLPIHFLHLINNSFPHICASRFIRTIDNMQTLTLQIDNFKLGKTPAWENLEQSGHNIQIFYSGDECNPLIATADLVVRLVEEQLHESVREDTMSRTLLSNCPIFHNKITPHNLGGTTEEKYYATPRLRLPAVTRQYIKHPILFMVGEKPPNFEFSPLFIKMQDMACVQKGSIKSFELADQQNWDVAKDKIILLDKNQSKIFSHLEEFGVKIPSLITSNDFLRDSSS